MKSNILFVGLNYKHTKKIAECVASKLDMFFLDVKDLIEYSLIDTKRVELLCGEKYLKKQEQNVILSVANYENTIINFPHDNFLKREINNIVSKNATTIYLRFDKSLLNEQNLKKNALNNLNMELIAFEELDALILEKVDIVINITNNKKETAVKQILNTLKNKG